jgi:hypothetical protein
MDEPLVYAWAIEYRVGTMQDLRRMIVFNDERHDRAYAEQRAADMHGEIVVLVRFDRRHHDGETTS